MAAFLFQEKTFLVSVQQDSKKNRMISEKTREGLRMKGYYTTSGFYGLVDGTYVLFADESDYYDFMEDEAA